MQLLTKETISNYHSITMKHRFILKLKLIQTKKSVFSAIGISATSEILAWLSSWRIFNCHHKQLLSKSWLLDVWLGSKCDKVFKNGQSEICGRQPLKIWSDMVCWRGKGCLRHILLGPFLTSLSQIYHWTFPLNFEGWELTQLAYKMEKLYVQVT